MEEYQCKTGYNGNLYYSSFCYTSNDSKTEQDVGFKYPINSDIIIGKTLDKKSKFNEQKDEIVLHPFVKETLGRYLFQWIYYHGRVQSYTVERYSEQFIKLSDNFLFCRVFVDRKKGVSIYSNRTSGSNIVELYKTSKHNFINFLVTNNVITIDDFDEEVELVEKEEEKTLEKTVVDTSVIIDFNFLVDLSSMIDAYSKDDEERKNTRHEMCVSFHKGELCSFIGCGCNINSVATLKYINRFNKDFISHIDSSYYLLHGECFYGKIDKKSPEKGSVFHNKIFKYKLDFPSKILSTFIDPLVYKKSYSCVNEDHKLSQIFDVDGSIFKDYVLVAIRKHAAGEIEMLQFSTKHFVSLAFGKVYVKISYLENYIIREVLDDFCSFLDEIKLSLELDKEIQIGTSFHQKFIGAEFWSAISKFSHEGLASIAFMITVMTQGFVEPWLLDTLVNKSCTNTNYFTGRFNSYKVWAFISSSYFRGHYFISNFNFLKSCMCLVRGYCPIFISSVSKEFFSVTNRAIVLAGDENTNNISLFFDSYDVLEYSDIQTFIINKYKYFLDNKTENEEFDGSITQILKDKNYYDLLNFNESDLFKEFRDRYGIF